MTTEICLLGLNVALTIALFFQKGIQMNQAEQDEFAKLNTKIDAELTAKLEINEALAKSQADLGVANATIADLTAKLAAVPAPVDDSAAVIAAVQAAEAKLDPPVVAAPAEPVPAVPAPVPAPDPVTPSV